MKILGLQLRNFSLLSLGLILSVSVNNLLAEEVYRQVDAEGNITFSDQPNPGAEKIDVAPTNVQHFPKPPVTKPPTDKSAEKASYKSLAISSPINDSTIRDPGDVLISAKISPALRKNHKVIFLDNGQPLGDPTRSLSMQLINLSRGTHMIQVQVIDTENKVLISSTPIAIHVHRNSIIKPQ
ncbi:MAG: DUF4124 domain-containing protein [Pseudomonadales bacterium]|nr:DUF4124 domain-containing protein [Pseudomonadales bacterium]